jgi:hypothetical protein
MFRYKAFISYSHRDEAICRWLHRRLEAWQAPRTLIGRPSARGPVPANLRPIFRDRDDFAGGASLKSATVEALQASEFLIVLCSPAAATSRYVDEEIRLFLASGRRENVLPIIVDGDPGAGGQQCFPDRIRFRTGPYGALSDDPADPIAADAREVGDGRQRAFVKLVAGLVGLPFDALMQRELVARRRRVALLAGAAAGAFCFATAFASFALYQSHQSTLAIHKSVFAIGGLIQETSRLPDDDRAIGATRRDMLRAQCDLADGLAQRPEQLGPHETAICFHHRLSSEKDRIGTVETMRKACRWLRSTLDAVTLPRAMHDVTQAARFALHKTADLLLEDVAAAETACPSLAVGGRRGILERALAEATRLAEARLSDGAVRQLHDTLVWEALKEVEAAGDWRAAAAIMTEAAALRARQAGDDGEDELHPATSERGIYLRRLGWLHRVHLKDPARALALADEALTLWTKGERRAGPSSTAAWQTALAYEVRADALAASGMPAEAVAAFRHGLVRYRALLAAPQGWDERRRRDIERLIAYNQRRITELGGAE